MSRHAYEDRLLRVMTYIHQNPAGDLSLDALAEVAAMSRFHWHRVFRAMTGETCAAAVRRIRLHRAAGWLVHGTDDWDQITARCGHDNPRSFARVFKDAYGMAPQAFRDRGEVLAPQMPRYQGECTMYDVTRQDHAARRLAGIPHRGPYMQIGAAFDRLGAIFSARDLWGQAQGMVAVFHDDITSVPEAELRSLAGLVVGDDFTMETPLEEVILPGGRHAVLRHVGPYTGLQAAYQFLYGTWLPESGDTPGNSPPFEIYLNSPMDTAPDDLVTDICIPLQPL